MRVATIREIGDRANDASDADQTNMCQQLAQQIQTEPDPIVRKAVQETIAEFDVPLADAVIVAGLNDDDRDVRLTCCRLLGKRESVNVIKDLSRVAKNDGDADVRMAAIESLGNFKSTDAVKGIAVGLKDRDPAMNYVAMNAMKGASGEDLGNDVQAWRQYAANITGVSDSASAIAAKPDESTKK
jgi:HEAT repeat protein